MNFSPRKSGRFISLLKRHEAVVGEIGYGVGDVADERGDAVARQSENIEINLYIAETALVKAPHHQELQRIAYPETTQELDSLAAHPPAGVEHPFLVPQKRIGDAHQISGCVADIRIDPEQRLAQEYHPESQEGVEHAHHAILDKPQHLPATRLGRWSVDRRHFHGLSGRDFGSTFSMGSDQPKYTAAIRSPITVTAQNTWGSHCGAPVRVSSQYATPPARQAVA